MPQRNILLISLKSLLPIIAGLFLLFIFVFGLSTSVGAVPYGCDAYGARVYSGSEQQRDCLPESDPGGLLDTGQVISIGASVALILAGSGLLVYFIRRKKKNSPESSQDTRSE